MSKNKEKTAGLEIALIGAGNVATHLGRALSEAGLPISCVYSRTMAHAEALAASIGAKAIDAIDDIPGADVFIFAVKDDVLAELVRRVAIKYPSSCFVHTAGSMSLSIFEGCAEKAAVMYPMQTFSKATPVTFEGLPIYVEATCDSAFKTVAELSRLLGAKVTPLSSENRKYLHLAAVFACNFANHCYALAAEVMEQAGLPFEDLLPLINQTTAKLSKMHPADGQTGPAVRDDKVVMQKQKALLQEAELAQQIYTLMSESIYQVEQRRKSKLLR